MVVWIIFMIQAFILIYIGLNRGFAKTFISFLVNIVNIVIAFFSARLLVNAIARKIGNKVIDSISTKYASDLGNMPVIETFSKFVSSVCIGIIEFFIIYIIMFIINTIIKKVLLYGKVEEKIKFNNKWATVGISVISGALTLMVFVTPIGIIYNSVIPALANKKVRNLPFVSTVYFDKLTEMPDNTDGIKTSEEVKYTVNTAMAAYYIIDGTNSEVDNVEIFRKNFEKSYFLPTVIGELGSTAAKQWKNGDEFLGSKAELPGGREGELTISFLEILEGWNKKVVVNDVNTILDIISLGKKYGTDKLEEDNGFLYALADQEFTEDLFVILYANKDFARMIPAVLEYGLGTAFDYVEIEMKEEYTSNVDVSKMSEEDVRREGRIVSGIIRTILEIADTNEKLNNGEMSIEDVEKIVEEVSKLKDSKVLGDIANEFVYQLSTNIANVQF